MMPVDEDFEARVMRVCERFGLEIREVRRQGVMVELVPREVEKAVALGADVLREVADAVGGDGVRYVALGLMEE